MRANQKYKVTESYSVNKLIGGKKVFLRLLDTISFCICQTYIVQVILLDSENEHLLCKTRVVSYQFLICPSLYMSLKEYTTSTLLPDPKVATHQYIRRYKSQNYLVNTILMVQLLHCRDYNQLLVSQTMKR